MSNDDRDAPRWGERTPEPERATPTPESAPHPQDDPPRYGERVAPETAPQPWPTTQPHSAPQPSGSQPGDSSDPQGNGQGQYGQGQYGQGQTGQAQYGQGQYGQGQTGQAQYGQGQYGQPQYGSSPSAYSGQGSQPGWAPHEQKRRRTLGVIALVAAVIALVLAVVGGIVFGNALAGIPGFMKSAQSGDSSALQERLRNDPTVMGPVLSSGLIGLVGTAFGIWAIVQGIIAIVTRRGRVYGIVALIVAVVAPIVFGVVYGAILASHG